MIYLLIHNLKLYYLCENVHSVCEKVNHIFKKTFLKINHVKY